MLTFTGAQRRVDGGLRMRKKSRRSNEEESKRGENEEGPDHKGCGRLDFTGQTCPRQLSNF